MQTIDLIFGEIHPWDYRVTRNLNNSRRSINFPVAFQTVDHLGGLQDRLWSSVSRRWNYGPTRDPLLRYYISRMRGEPPGLLHRGPPTIRLTLLRIILDRWNNKLDSTTFPNFILPFIVLLPKIQNIFPSIRFNQQLNVSLRYVSFVFVFWTERYLRETRRQTKRPSFQVLRVNSSTRSKEGGAKW